ncbi:hypothetical protein GCM10009087_45050 [Sphingomonas oligophenolica]
MIDVEISGTARRGPSAGNYLAIHLRADGSATESLPIRPDTTALLLATEAAGAMWMVSTALVKALLAGKSASRSIFMEGITALILSLYCLHVLPRHRSKSRLSGR